MHQSSRGLTTTGHVSDERLVEICFEGEVTRAEHEHFAQCDHCTARWGRLESMLREVSDAATAEADAMFGADRLAMQRGRIMQRIEQDGRPARVIAFPASQAPDVRPLRTRPATRWIAGAAAAGLAIGLLAGHLTHDLPTFRPVRSPMARVTTAVQQPSLRAVNVSLNDDEFIDEIEQAIAGPSVLRTLNDLTPQ
jgi:hypothetical protein